MRDSTKKSIQKVWKRNGQVGSRDGRVRVGVARKGRSGKRSFPKGIVKQKKGPLRREVGPLKTRELRKGDHEDWGGRTVLRY